jgi:hypothetical protein
MLDRAECERAELERYCPEAMQQAGFGHWASEHLLSCPDQYGKRKRSHVNVQELCQVVPGVWPCMSKSCPGKSRPTQPCEPCDLRRDAKLHAVPGMHCLDIHVCATECAQRSQLLCLLCSTLAQLQNLFRVPLVTKRKHWHCPCTVIAELNMCSWS